MKRVKYLQCMAGEYYVRDVGHECDIDDAEALRLVKAGFVELVVAAKEREPKSAK